MDIISEDLEYSEKNRLKTSPNKLKSKDQKLKMSSVEKSKEYISVNFF
jgi:hypothetical protein